MTLRRPYACAEFFDTILPKYLDEKKKIIIFASSKPKVNRPTGSVHPYTNKKDT